MYALVNSDIWGNEGDTVIIHGDRIVKVGWEHSLRDYLIGIRRFDVNGATILPSLHEAHSHPHVTGKYWVNLRGVRSIDEFLNKLRSFRERVKPTYVVGRGWDQELIREGRPPSIDELDEALGRVPAVLVRFCGHVAVVNSAMINFIKGRGLYDKLIHYMEFIDGKPTGLIFEKGVELVLNSILRPSMTELIEGLRKLLLKYRSLGVLYINFMDVGIKHLKALHEALKLVSGMHVSVYVNEGDVIRLGRDVINYNIDLSSSGSELIVMGIKVFMDGSLGGRTAFLRERYSDGSTRGMLLKDSRALEGTLKFALTVFSDSRRPKLAVHAIGDGALDEFIAFARKLKGGLKELLRVEHASLSPKDIIESMACLGIPVAVQPHFLVSDWWAEKRLGKARTRWLYPFKSMIRSGVKICGSSDYPVEPLNPYLGMSAASSRGNLQYLSYMERLSLSESINMYLWDPCFGRSVIAEGARADLIVLRECVRELNPYDLPVVKPALLIASGRMLNVSN